MLSSIDMCLFCPGDEGSPLTTEHVNPKWLLEFLGTPRSDQMLQGVAEPESGALVGSPRIHASFSFVQGSVCAACNNGWMSRLEDASRPILMSLIRRVRALSELTPDEAAIIAKWAAKTAYLHTYAGPLKDFVRREHLAALCGDAGTLPPGAAVFGMQAGYVQRSSYVQTAHWPQWSAHASQSADTPSAAYKIGLQYEQLYLLVAFWSNASSRLTYLVGTHVPVYPPNADFGSYHGELPTYGGPVGRVKAFSDWLAVTHATPRQ